MPQVPFSALPPRARLWIFAAERPLTGDAATTLLSHVDAFVESWKAHGAALTAARDWRFDRFLLVGVDEEAAGVSGCSIDALTRTLRQLESTLGLRLMETAPVFYRDGDTIRRAERADFKGKAERGEVDQATLVFDNTVATVGALSRWETPAGATWHARAFPLKHPAIP